MGESLLKKTQLDTLCSHLQSNSTTIEGHREYEQLMIQKLTPEFLTGLKFIGVLYLY